MSYFETELGYGEILATDTGICRINLPDGSVNPKGSHSSSHLTEQVAEMLGLYFKGERQAFELIPVDLSGLTAFRMRILTLIRSIPYGEIRSYGEVSSMAGSPHSARAVGGAMAANPVPVIIPCHRVISSNGLLTGFTAPGGLKLKKILLQAEGIEFYREQVARKLLGYKHALPRCKKT